MEGAPIPGPAKTVSVTPAAPEAKSFLSRFIGAFTNTGLPCPETAEGLFKHAKEKQAAPFMNSGFKFALGMPVGENLQHVHTFLLGTPKEQKYSMQAFYLEEFKKANGEKTDASMVMTGDIDTEGNLQGTLQFNPRKNTKVGVQMGITASSIYVFEAEHKGADFNCAVRMIPDLVKGQNTVTMSYNQSVTEKLALGVEAVYDVFSEPPPHTWRDLNLSWLGFYKGSDWNFSGRVGAGQAQLAYSRRMSPKAAMSTEFVVDARMNSTWNIAYSFDLRFGKVKGQIDTTGAIHGVLEKPFAFGTFLMCATTQGLSTPSQKFGAALIIG